MRTAPRGSRRDRQQKMFESLAVDYWIALAVLRDGKRFAHVQSPEEVFTLLACRAKWAEGMARLVERGNLV